MRIALYKHFIDMLLLVFGAMFAIKPAFQFYIICIKERERESKRIKYVF